jgi:phospholipid/cholesterol/gamma-HCH transport system permease protein
LAEASTSSENPARIEFGDGATLRASGDWIIRSLGEADAKLRALALAGRGAATLDLTRVERYDTAGAWLLYRATILGRTAREAAIIGGDPGLAQLIAEIAKHAQPLPVPPRRSNAVLHMIARLGESFVTGSREGVSMLGFIGLILVREAKTAAVPRRLRLVSVVHHIEQSGLDALPIAALVSFLVGAVIAFLASDILANYGGAIFSVDLISIAFFREFGVILAAIMVAGRSGSAFTAEIGAMKGHEEIDAMRALGLDPVELLVLPRVLALLVSLPLLTFVADMMGLIGGGIAVWSTLGLDPQTFINRLLSATDAHHFWVGLIKAPFFAFLIAIIGCYQGFKVTGSAESMGRRTTLSVVQSIFTVIVVDALFAIFFLKVGY